MVTDCQRSRKGAAYSEWVVAPSTFAYGGTAKEAGPDGHIIEPAELQEIAAKSTR